LLICLIRGSRAWFQEWEELDGATAADVGMYGGAWERLSEEQRARLVGELADAIPADPRSWPPRMRTGGISP
jgi:hypothetical protein